jgi:hypothetical protein
MDGLKPTGRGTEVKLVDPTGCSCGRFRFGMRRYTQCEDWDHGGHTTWECACGQLIYRWPGRFAGEPLECLR